MMNSYGDPNSAHGRAQVPGSGGGYDYDYDWRDADQAPVAGVSAMSAGHAGAGRASVGRASVGRASVGQASVGRAGVGQAGVGRAAVPGSVTGRASVRPVVPVSPPVGMGGPAGPGGPHAPGGPGGTRARGGTGRSARAKRNKRRNLIIGALAVFIMISGVGVVAGTWYYDEVPTPTEFGVPEATTILFADGSPLAKLGEVNRSVVPISKIPVDVQHAVVSAEDRKFYEHDGIDFAGIGRAAWNNLTGGDLQGASTITQQYARMVVQMNDITYARKIREAIIASKLEQDLEKEDILYHYLNAIYFGRGAYGIEAAAQTFFNVSVDQLTVEQAAVLAAIIKQPEPKGDVPGFDPARDEAAAKDRWNYVLNGMVEKGWLDAAKRDQMQYPPINPYDPNAPPCATGCGIDRPTGNVVNYVRDEMKAMGIDDWNEGGYQVTTSINRTAQEVLEKTIRRDVPGSALNGQPPNLMAASVAIDPATGRVVAYYGGENGTGTDYAGLNVDEKTGDKFGTHPPGSSFKIYTLAAGIEQGISMNSRWDATKIKDGDFTISNAGRNATCEGGGTNCTLREATIKSYNVPFYWMAKAIGPDKVIDAARAAGVRTLTPDSGQEVDLTQINSGADVAGQFHNQIGYGQYGITVLDHANGVATFAARGVYRPAHFVVEVKQRDANGQWTPVQGEQVKPQEVYNPNQVDDIVAVLEDLPDKPLSSRRPSGRKTGTWELQGTNDNAHAWMVGFTPQIAAAVWVGNVAEDLPLKYKPPGSSRLTAVFGANLPGDIWKRFMDETHKALGLEVKRFPPAKNTGREDHEAANGTSPTPSSDPACVIIPQLCPPERGGGGGGRGGDN